MNLKTPTACDFKLPKIKIYKALRTREKHTAEEVAVWDAKVGVGDLVCLHRDNGEIVRTRTRSTARAMGDTAVAWFEGVSGCYAIRCAHEVTGRRQAPHPRTTRRSDQGGPIMRHRGFPPTDAKGRARSAAASKSWSAVAERLRCPACDRKNALGQAVEIERGLNVRRCRYCQKERVIDIRKHIPALTKAVQ